MRTHARRTLAAAIATCAATCAAAHARQCGSGWQSFPAQTGNPSARGANFTLDTTRNKLVVFGGLIASTNQWSMETWEFDLATGVWALISNAGPVPRSGAVMAFDPGRNRTVMMGGLLPNTSPVVYLDETWEWDGAAWVLAGAGTGAIGFGAAYDPTMQKIVRLGGARLNECGACGWPTMQEFQAWDGVSYQSLTLPPLGFGQFGFGNTGLAFDPVAATLFATSGYYCCGTGQPLTAPGTWEFDGAWTNLGGGPSGNHLNAPFVFHDPAQARMGAVRAAGGLQFWNGSSWTSLPETNAGVNARAFDAASGRLLGLRVNTLNGTLDAVSRDLNTHPVFIRTRTPDTDQVYVQQLGQLSLSITTGGATGATYVWRRNGQTLPDTGSSLTINQITCAQLGTYTVTATASCGAPVSTSWQVSDAYIEQHPQSYSTTPNSFAVFTTSIGPPGAVFQYQWRRNGQLLPDAPPYFGVQTTTLSISPVTLQMNGDEFRLSVAHCGAPLLTNPATLTVICSGDANGDGLVNFADLNIVLSQFGQSGAGLQGDVTGDGVVNFADLNLVLSRFGAVC